MTYLLERSTLVLAMFALVAAAGPARAEQQAGTPAGQSGPLVLERIASGIVAAPDVKVAEVDAEVGTLVGGYLGWLGDESLLIGGAGYWLANGRDDLEMAYGGLLIGWTFNGDGRIAFGARSLVGLGQATLSDQVLFGSAGRSGDRFRSVRFGSPGGPAARHVLFDEGFVLIEPQGNLIVRLTDSIRLDCGVGYRAVGAANGFEERLRGVSGSLAIRFGGGQQP